MKAMQVFACGMARSMFAAVGALASLGLSAGAGATDVYELTDLGVLPNGGFSNGAGINVSGETVGTSDASDAFGNGNRAFLMSDPKVGMQNLGLPPVPSVLFSSGLALNDFDEVVVNGNNGANHAFLWSKGFYTDLTTLPNAVYSEGQRINNAGHVVGNVVLDLGGGNFPHHAFLHDGAQMIDLNPLFGGNYSEANDINESGTVVGAARFAGSSIIHAFIEQDGRITNLGSVNPITSVAYAVNDLGAVAGGAYFDGAHEHPMLYTGGALMDLGLLPDAVGGTATALNDDNTVVGYFSMSYGVKRAFVYSGGQLRDLTSLLPPGSEWKVEEADDINDAGQIVATARNPQGLKHAVVLTPQSICGADLDGDFNVNSADIGILLGDWGVCPGCNADINADGVVDSADLAILLGAWGPC